MNGKEEGEDVDMTTSKCGSIIRLSPGKCNADEQYDGSRDSSSDGTMEQLSVWLKKKKKSIFRKKTLFMRFPVLQWLPKYSIKEDLVADLIAGLTIAITVIPQGLAYATVAGLPPEVKFHSHNLKKLNVYRVYFLFSMVFMLRIWAASCTSFLVAPKSLRSDRLHC